jgi:hypothetical protein
VGDSRIRVAFDHVQQRALGVSRWSLAPAELESDVGELAEGVVTHGYAHVMASKRDEPTQTTDKRLEIPVPTRKAWDDTLAKVIKPVDGPPEIEDAAREESDIPADETDEG